METRHKDRITRPIVEEHCHAMLSTNIVQQWDLNISLNAIRCPNQSIERLIAGVGHQASST